MAEQLSNEQINAEVVGRGYGGGNHFFIYGDGRVVRCSVAEYVEAGKALAALAAMEQQGEMTNG